VSYIAVVQADSPNLFFLLNEASGTFTDQQGGLAAAGISGAGAAYRTATGFPAQPYGITIGSTTSGIAVVSNESSQNVTGTSVSWEFCMAYNGSLVGQPFIFGKGHDGTNGGYAIMINSGGSLNIWVSGLGSYWNSGYVMPSDTTVRHYIVTLNGTTGTIYQNGVNVKAGMPSGIVTATAGTDVFPIGSGHTSGGGFTNQLVGGIVANVSLYPSVLSPARVTAHYNALTTAGSSGTSNTAPPGQAVASLAHDRNQQRKEQEQPGHRFRLSDYYRHRRHGG